MTNQQATAEKAESSPVHHFQAFSGGQLSFSEDSAVDSLEIRIGHLCGLQSLIARSPRQNLDNPLMRNVLELAASLADDVYRILPIALAELRKHAD